MMAAALLLAGCTSDDNVAVEPQQQAQATVIRVTVGAGITDPTPDPSPTREGSSADDGAAAPLPSRGGTGVGSVTHSAGSSATTRSAVTTSGGTRTLTFTGPVGDPGDDGYSPGDRLYIVRALADGKCLAGELTMKGSPTEDGTQATFEGDLTVYDSEGGEATHDFGGEDPLEGSTATLIHAAMSAKAGDYSFNFETRALTFDEATRVAASVEALMTKGLRVSGGYDGSGFALQKATAQPILGCTIAGLTAGATFAMAYSVSADGSTYDDITTGSVTADAQGTATFACLATEEYNDGQASHTNIYHRIRLTNTADGADTYDVSIGQKELQSKVYNLSRIWYDGAMHRLVDLDGVTKTTHPEGLTLKDGDVVKGLLNGYSKISQRLQISIADGATVILKGVVIRGNDDTRYMWAGLTCLGDATIILADGSKNTVKGFHENYPGIFIAGGYTLTIRGSGSLAASPYDGGTTKSYGAGIGGAQGVACGNIVIEGGDITATSGSYAAGIGGGRNVSCGTITISGGTVNATGYTTGAGIGSGEGTSTKPSTCGDITISGTAHVTATSDYGTGIGSGEYGTVSGTISISGSANVTATGGEYSAGIGSGHEGSCNAINITGGTVTANGGGTGNVAAGIGSGYYGSCGAIVIGSGITKVVATKRGNNSAHIGAGANGSCGTVTIDGMENATTSSTFPHLTSTVDGNTWTLTKASN